MGSRAQHEVIRAGDREVALSNPRRCCSPVPATPSSTWSATTSPLPTARCAAPAAGRTCWCATRTASRRSSSTRSGRPRRGRPGSRSCRLSFPSGRTAEEVVPRDAAALAWMANLACLELHPHPVRADDLDHPDELRVDLDPVPGVEWPQVREVAGVVHATLDDFGLVGWPKTSGSRGIHVYVRIERRWTFDRGAPRRAGAGPRGGAARADAGDQQVVEGGAARRVPGLQPERQGPHGRRRLLGAAHGPTPACRRRSTGTRSTAATRPTSRCHDAGAVRELGDRHAAIDARRLARALLELSAPRARGPGRRAVAAALPEAAGEPPRVQPSQAAACQASADRDRPRAQGGCAGGLERWKARHPGRPRTRARRRAGRRHARPLTPGRASASTCSTCRRCGRLRSRSTRDEKTFSSSIRRRDLELVVAAVARPLVGPPAQEDRGVAEAIALQVVVLHLAHPLDPQRLPRQVLARAPAALRRRACASVVATPARRARGPLPPADDRPWRASRSGSSSLTSCRRVAMVNDDVTPTCCSVPASS